MHLSLLHALNIALKTKDIIIYGNVSTAELYVHLPSHCWSVQPFTWSGFSRRAFPIFSTVFLEIAAANSSDQRPVFQLFFGPKTLNNGSARE